MLWRFATTRFAFVCFGNVTLPAEHSNHQQPATRNKVNYIFTVMSHVCGPADQCIPPSCAPSPGVEGVPAQLWSE